MFSREERGAWFIALGRRLWKKGWPKLASEAFFKGSSLLGYEDPRDEMQVYEFPLPEGVKYGVWVWNTKTAREKALKCN